MTTLHQSRIAAWTLYITCVALAVVVWLGGGLMIRSHYPALFGVANWRTSVDRRLFTDINEFDKAVEGRSRQQVLSLLGNPDGAPAVIDVVQFFRSGSGRQVIYYSIPKFGLPFILQAVELSNDKVTGTYRTVENPLWMLLYVAVLVYGIMAKLLPKKDHCAV